MRCKGLLLFKIEWSATISIKKMLLGTKMHLLYENMSLYWQRLMASHQNSWQVYPIRILTVLCQLLSTPSMMSHGCRRQASLDFHMGKARRIRFQQLSSSVEQGSDPSEVLLNLLDKSPGLEARQRTSVCQILPSRPFGTRFGILEGF